MRRVANLSQFARRPFDDFIQRWDRFRECAHAVTPIFGFDVPVRVDPTQLQAHSLPLLGKETVPGMIANAEHQHFAEFRWELEGKILAIRAVQNPKPTALERPFAAEAQDHRDDLVFRIGMRVALIVIARSITHHQKYLRVGTEIDIEFLLVAEQPGRCG
jgi:hypothetical protein